ncbi:DUF4360 domain-containing protein [Lentzea tibetensis]|nr:DUF4360 domain-containing protein [Lentzea tibetensis]
MAAATLMALSALAPVDATDDADPAAPPVRVEVVTVNGSGCPAGTSEVTTRGRTFSVSYSAFFAQAGGGARPTDFRKNCQLNIRVSLPEGYTYGLARSSYNGFAHLEAGATALHRINFYFQGMSSTTYLNYPFSGPMSDDWQSTYRPRPSEIVYSPCGENRNLNINAELRVNLGTSDRTQRSFILAAESNGAVRAKYDFTTKPC